MFRYNAVLFDMDGTLLDTADDIADALNQTLLEHRYPAHGSDKVKRFLGNGAYRLVQRALPEHTDGAVIETVLAEFQALYARQYNRLTRPFPGVLPMLTALGEAGLRMAIISNKGDQNVRRLTKAHFGSLIHIAVGARDGLPLKPAPEPLLIAMRELGVEPERTLYIGDADTDFHAAQNAGTDCILVRWGYGDPGALELLSPLFFANDPAELPMLILQQEEDVP
jgi:phosphoglycolate phosphatase